MDPHIIISPRRPYHSLPLVVLVLPLPLFQVSQAKIIKKLGVINDNEQGFNQQLKPNGEWGAGGHSKIEWYQKQSPF